MAERERERERERGGRERERGGGEKEGLSEGVKMCSLYTFFTTVSFITVSTEAFVCVAIIVIVIVVDTTPAICTRVGIARRW